MSPSSRYCTSLPRRPYSRRTTCRFRIDGLTSQARSVRVHLSRRALHASWASPCHFSAKYCFLGTAESGKWHGFRPLLSGRVEGRRACGRWRVSRPALSMTRWVHNATVATFPAPAPSNAACGFPALRFPARFTSRVMGPRLLGALSAPVVGAAPGSPCTSPGACPATASSTSASRSPAVSVHASDDAGLSFPPNLCHNHSPASPRRQHSSGPSRAGSG